MPTAAVALTFATYYYSVVTVVSCSAGARCSSLAGTYVDRGFPLGWFSIAREAWTSIKGVNFALDTLFYLLILSSIVFFANRIYGRRVLRSDSAKSVETRIGPPDATALALYTLGLLFIFIGGVGLLFEIWIPTGLTPQLATDLFWYLGTGIGLIAPTVFYAILSSTHRA